MGTARDTKASDKQAVCKKLLTLMKKRYDGSVPANSRNVMETLLYAVCLENRTEEVADSRYEGLHARFHDWNEIRVSSITELEEVFAEDDDGSFRALRVKAALQDTFDQHVVTGEPRDDPFDLEPVKKKTQDQAARRLAKIRETTPFTRAYVLQAALGSHVVPLDEKALNAAVWLGFVEPDAAPDAAMDTMKSVVRKTDGPLFAHLLRQLANDAKPAAVFETVSVEDEEEYDPLTAVQRLEDVYKGRVKRKKAKAAKKKAPATKKSAAKATKTKGAAKKKPAAKKKAPAKKKTATKKKVAKKTTRKKSSSRS